MKYKIKFLSFLLLLVFIYSCKEDMSKQINKESLAIVTKLYNEESVGIPPPPLEGQFSLEESLKSKRDTIYNSDKYFVKNIYAVSYIDQGLDNDHIQSFFENSGNSLVSFQSSELDSFRLKDRNGNTIYFVDNKAKLEKVKLEYNVIGVLYYSDIIFNENLDLATTLFVVKRHGLDAASLMVRLKKINGTWEFLEIKVLSFS